MKFGFYPRLAADGIRKNKRLYLPYILTCIGMVMMTYIINFLKYSESIKALPGFSTIEVFMNIGTVVVLVFSALFLFYSNSFLSRRRKKEFGLYNILGMGKKNLAVIITWESVFVTAISLFFGLVFGIAFSKLAELGFVNLMSGETSFKLSVSVESVLFTVIPFLLIFLLLLLNSLRQVWFSSTISLLRSENTGEKPPKSNWILALIGIVILAAAYVIALTIKSPLTAITAFAVAVIMVIIATYLIMIAGSVFFCRMLQRREKFYYKSNHFVSVSSMVYRMKRNGAGLASICILATMILVMISSTSALFIGGEDVIDSRYPRDINTWFRMYENKFMSDEDQKLFESTIEDVLKNNGAEKSDIITYHAVTISGSIQNGEVIFDPNSAEYISTTVAYEGLHQIYLVPIEDYNFMMKTDVVLSDDEVLIYSPRNTFKNDTFGFTGLKQYKVKEIIKDCFMSSDMAMDIAPAIMVICNDIQEMSKGLIKVQTDDNGEEFTVDFTYSKWYYCFNTSLDDESDIVLNDKLTEAFEQLQNDDHDNFALRIESRESKRADFYSLYGGIFYLGIILSIVFIFAAVLIIYYKQISEGYEDQSRFEIMQKIGMTKKDIRKSINSQLLTVFFLPLAGAGLHLAFAFPIIKKLLLLFNLNNPVLFACTTVGSFLVFALFYTIVYRITSNAYYNIVSGAKGKE